MITKPKSKLPTVGQTIFGEMNAIAQANRAINLGQGFPDFMCPEPLLNAVHESMLRGENQYAPMPGVEPLRRAIASKIAANHGHAYHVDHEITVTVGATEALMSSFQALLHVGDEAILIEPSYDLYEPAIRLCGAKPVRVTMRVDHGHPSGFRMDWDAVQDAMTAKTRLLVLNFPHNPTGLTLKPDDVAALEAILSHHPVTLISDEAYEHIHFDGTASLSPIDSPMLAERTVHISSFGKSLHTTGWRVGYCCAPRLITAEIRKVHQYNVFAAATPLQYGIARYLDGANILPSLPAFYQEKRDRLVQGLKNTAFRALHTEGTFFVLIDASTLGQESERELAIRMATELGVVAIPVSAFYANPAAPEANHGLLRLCFAKRDETLNAALGRLQAHVLADAR